MFPAIWRRGPKSRKPGSKRNLCVEALEERRLLSAGSLDLTFGPFGYTTTALDGKALNASSIAVQADGKIVVAGNISNFSATSPDSNAQAPKAVALARYNPDGLLDTNFGGGGIVPANFTGQGLPSGQYNPGLAVALQGDGKIVVAGSTATASGNQFDVERFNPDGTVDTSFGQGGSEVIDFGTGASEAHALAITRDGKILVVGEQDSGRSVFALARLQANGNLDTSFGPDHTGLVSTVFSIGQGASPPPPGPRLTASATAVVLQADGSFYVAGTATTLGPSPGSPAPPVIETGFALARYTADGNLDATFGSGGTVTTDLQGFDTATSLAVQADGMIVVAGSAQGSEFGLVRYQANGALDPHFGTGGIVITEPVWGDARVNGIVLQRDGKIVAAGAAGALPMNGVTPPSQNTVALARYNGDGSLDPSFGDGGIVTTAIGSDAFVGVALQSDGKIVAVANTYNSGFAVARYLVQDDPGGLNQRYLAQLYRDLLHRNIDATGLAGFGGLLDKGLVSRADVAHAIENSLEFKTLEVRALYHELLGRDADPVGLQGWAALLLNGGTEVQIEALMAGSAEFYLHAGASNAAFLSALYGAALGRAVDATGAAAFGNALASGVSRTAIAALIFSSVEADQDLIENFYARSLHRAADLDSLNGWVAALQHGARQTDIRALIVGSDEYLQTL